MSNKLNKKVMILSSIKGKVTEVMGTIEKQIVFKTKSGCKTCNGRK